MGDVDKALASDAVEATYEVPFLAHATMEPLNCTAHVTPAGCEIWIGTQVMTRVQQAVADAAGVRSTRSSSHNHLLGGGFGRRLEADMASDAVRIARHVDGPVKVVWTREEDIQHDVYRPSWHDRFSAHLKTAESDGWKHVITGSSVIARFLPAAVAGGRRGFRCGR